MSLLHFRRTFVEKMFALHGKVVRLVDEGHPLGRVVHVYLDGDDDRVWDALGHLDDCASSPPPSSGLRTERQPRGGDGSDPARLQTRSAQPSDTASVPEGIWLSRAISLTTKLPPRASGNTGFPLTPVSLPSTITA
jgi:hypothetical protein